MYLNISLRVDKERKYTCNHVIKRSPAYFNTENGNKKYSKRD